MDYEKKAKEHELRQSIKARERQAIFEEAFETEVQLYKQSGTIPSIFILFPFALCLAC